MTSEVPWLANDGLRGMAWYAHSSTRRQHNFITYSTIFSSGEVIMISLCFIQTYSTYRRAKLFFGRIILIEINEERPSPIFGVIFRTLVRRWRCRYSPSIEGRSSGQTDSVGQHAVSRLQDLDTLFHDDTELIRWSSVRNSRKNMHV